MADKYQKSIDLLNNFISEDGASCDQKDLINAVRELQELINKYSKIQQFDRAVFFNANGVVVNGISYEQLEKALDLACQKLAIGCDCAENYQKDCKECNKEWLLKCVSQT